MLVKRESWPEIIAQSLSIRGSKNRRNKKHVSFHINSPGLGERNCFGASGCMTLARRSMFFCCWAFFSALVFFLDERAARRPGRCFIVFLRVLIFLRPSMTTARAAARKARP